LAKPQHELRGQSMRAAFGLNAEPGAQAYVWANRISWCIGIFAALVLFALVPHWYIALPVGLFGCWVTTSLCGLLWYELREAFNCTDQLHRILAAVTLILALLVGLVALYLIPNWSDFDFKGHPSLVAVAGSALLGVLSFILAAGAVAFLGVMFSGLTLRLLGRNTHSYDG
jgi:tellurite resistance protein TehA-like permease